jgi:aldehyde:ferredoxin oxidoreductase
MSKIIRVDMGSKEVKIGECPEKYAGLAGRGLTSHFVADEVKPTCHPLGKNNKLIFAPGFPPGPVQPTPEGSPVAPKAR